MNRNPEQQSDLLWDAFRYIADEMSADECEVFEQRLSDDQAARESVVQAVQLTQAVMTLPEKIPVPASILDRIGATSKRSAVWIVPAVVTVCLVFAFGLLMNGPFQGNPGEVQSGSQHLAVDAENAGSLVAYWSDSDSTLQSFLSDEMPNGESIDEEQLDTDSIVALSESIEEITVPEWMISAVAAELQQGELPPETKPEEL